VKHFRFGRLHPFALSGSQKNGARIFSGWICHAIFLVMLSSIIAQKTKKPSRSRVLDELFAVLVPPQRVQSLVPLELEFLRCGAGRQIQLLCCTRQTGSSFPL
jgi:hypothetical protein